MVKVKICCISSIEEAELAIRYGADALGLVSWMPSGTGIISDQTIKQIAASIPAHIKTFLLTCQQEPEAIVSQQQHSGADTIQIVDELTAEGLGELRAKLPGVALVQVIHVVNRSSVDTALKLEHLVDYVLLDSGQPDAATPKLGGTGRVHDWSISAEIVDRLSCPVYLAGGLHPGNVAEAITNVRPYGVDVCSRLRPGNKLDESLLAKFFSEVRHAAEEVAD